MLLVFSIVSLPAPVWAGHSNSLMDISTDGVLLACSNRDSGTVTIIDLKSHKKVWEATVGEKPEGVSFLGTTHNIAVAVYAEDKVVLLDADAQKTIGVIDVFDEPYGVVSAEDDPNTIYVTLDFPGRVLEIDISQRKVKRSIDVGAFIRGIAISPKEKRLFVTEFYTSKLIAIDTTSGKLVDEWPGLSTDNLCRQVALHPKRPKAYIPHIRSRTTVPHGEGSIFPYVTIADTRPLEGKRRSRVPMDAFLNVLVTANPWETAVTPDGRIMFVVFAGSDDMFAANVIDDDYREISYRKYIRLGRNPRAVRVAPDGDTVYVYNALDFEVVAYQTDSLSKVATITVCDSPLSEEILTGKRLFYSALQPMVGRRWISCASCHPDGQPDSRTWHNPEGLRNTQSLAGMAWTHPIHWSADRDEVQDFEHTIRGQLMQGRGLISGKLNDALGEPNRGLSKSLDALSAYANSHKATISPFAKNGLSDEAKRGREVFFSETTKCSSCHTGPLYTDSRPTLAKEILRHDVGTGESDPSELMGPKYDTPSLIGAYRTAPYLHHGAALTLEEVFTKYNKDDRHGVTSQLSEPEVSALVEFIRALPYEDVEAKAKAAGLKKVTN